MKYVLLLIRLLVLHDAGGAGRQAGDFFFALSDVGAHAGIGALRRAEKC